MGSRGLSALRTNFFVSFKHFGDARYHIAAFDTARRYADRLKPKASFCGHADRPKKVNARRDVEKSIAPVLF